MEIAHSRVGEFLPLQANGYACPTEQLLDVLLAVSCQKETVEQVCSDWTGDLPSTGDYEISVGGTRGNATYKLTVSIK